MRILFLSRWLPYPPDNGAKIRIFNLLKQLAPHHEVSLVAFAAGGEADDGRAVRELKQLCASVVVVPYRPFRPSSRRALAGFLSPRPRFLVDTDSPAMRAAAAKEAHRRRCQLVIVSQLDMVPYASVLPLPAILEEVELSIHWDAARRGMRSALTWLKLRSYLRRTLPRFAACTVVSENERRVLLGVAPGTRVEVIPNAVDLSRYAGDFGPPRRNTLVFAGALSYGANYDAVRGLLGEIYPEVVRAAPAVQLQITGSTRGVDLAALPSCPNARFTGYVDDVRPLIAQSWASLVPLRIGGGTRLKILESMALGTPVVSTAKGAEGLDVTHGENILIADSPAEFARTVVTLLGSPELRSRLSAGGRRLVRARYDWDVVGRDLRALVASVGEARSARGPVVRSQPARLASVGGSGAGS